MTSKTAFADITANKLVNKINDLTIGEDSADYLTVNSETRFLNDVNIGGSSIKLRSTDDTNANNFIEIMGERLHSTHVKTIRSINNNKIDGDLTIGEDDSDMLTIASKLHIPRGLSGQVLTKGTDGSIEYGPTAFSSISHKVTTIAFSVYSDGTGDNTVSNAAMPFNTVIFNKGGGEFNTSTYKYKVKTEGVYYIWFYWYTSNTSDTQVRCYIYKNNNMLTNHGLRAGMSNEGGFLVDLAVDDEIWLKSGNSSGYNVTYYAEALHNGFGAFLVGGSTTFTTANPLLANPSTADKGKIVTVNSAGDDLQYGPEFIEVETVYAHLQPVYDGSVNTNFDNGIVTYRPISTGPPLGLTSYSVGGITLDSNNQGIKFPSNGDYKMDFNINIRTTSSTAT